MLNRAIIFFPCCLILFGAHAQDIASTFSTAKRWAERDIYFDRRTSFYCGCAFNEKKEVDQASCGYEPRRPLTRSGRENKRDNRIEWEHVLPASIMGQHLTCWGAERGQFPQCVKSNGKLRSGRACCLKVNATFSKAHNDLVNLTPTVGEVNGDRSNLRYGEVAGEPRQYGQCDFEIQNRVVEPTHTIRGDIARMQLYMLNTYGQALGFVFDPSRLNLLQNWHNEDPIDAWERKRNQRICARQGKGNVLVGQCS